MQIICISRGSYSGGKDLAESLARMLGYTCIGREQLLEEATKSGIAVGRLETAMLKTRHLNERLLLEKDHFMAFVVQTFCDRILNEGNVVYHGRTGHLLLAGIENLLKVRVIADMESRVTSVMTRLGLGRNEAKRYIGEAEESRRRWVHTFYNVDWNESQLYDVTVNLERISIENASVVLNGMARQPEFQATPSSVRALRNLCLASKVRVAIARDERTRDMPVQVGVHDATATVSYLPRHADKVDSLREVVSGVEGVRDYRCNMASTNILWIQERFDVSSETCRDVIDLAARWDAAVEIMCLSYAPDKPPPNTEEETAAMERSKIIVHDTCARAGRITRDFPEEDPAKREKAVRAIMEDLNRVGCCGRILTVKGSTKNILNAIDRTREYSLVVVGDVFTAKGDAARTRLTRELCNFLSDNLRNPVVEGGELKAEYGFDRRQALKLIACGAVAVALFLALWTFQLPILKFLKGDTAGRYLPPLAVVLVSPVFAYFWGTTARLALKILKVE